MSDISGKYAAAIEEIQRLKQQLAEMTERKDKLLQYSMKQEQELEELREQLAEKERELAALEKYVAYHKSHHTARYVADQAKRIEDLERESESINAQLDCKVANEEAGRHAWAIANKSVDQQERISELEEALRSLLHTECNNPPGSDHHEGCVHKYYWQLVQLEGPAKEGRAVNSAAKREG